MWQNNPWRLIPEWEKPEALVLVWPEEVQRKYLSCFYARFISLIPDDIKLICLLKNRGIEKEVKESIRKYNSKINIQCLSIPEIADIWIRDWAPIPAIDSTGKNVAIKTIYKPAYLSKTTTYLAKAKSDDAAGKRLAEITRLPVVNIPLIWDIDNLTHNGEGTAIVTKRLINHNKSAFSELEIRELLEEKLSITRLIVIDEEPGDETGHVDGMVRFLSPDTVAVGSYPRKWQGGNQYFMDRIAVRLKQELGFGYKIIRVLNGIPPEEKSEGMSSASGNHLNFLRLGNLILVPAYGIPEDENAIETLRKNLSNANVIPVNIPGIKLLASKGGVLNCITWVYF
jgi:agmatine deiminase